MLCMMTCSPPVGRRRYVDLPYNTTQPERARHCRDLAPAPPPASGDGVAAFRLRDPDLTPSKSKEGEVRITPTALRTM